MNYFEKTMELERLNQLIRLKATGSPDQLAAKLEISRRCVYDYIELVKLLGGPVLYDAIRKTYYYEYEVEFVIGFIKKDEYLKRIKGGLRNNFNIFENNFDSANFLHNPNIPL